MYSMFGQISKENDSLEAFALPCSLSIWLIPVLFVWLIIPSYFQLHLHCITCAPQKVFKMFMLYILQMPSSLSQSKAGKKGDHGMLIESAKAGSQNERSDPHFLKLPTTPTQLITVDLRME